MKNQLQSMSNNFSLKAYKTANQEYWYGFERGKDLRIQICWKGDCIWEWISEKSLWVQRNINKEDRVWMRRHADVKLEACKKSLIKKKTSNNIRNKKTEVCRTQDAFEKMKQK